MPRKIMLLCLFGLLAAGVTASVQARPVSVEPARVGPYLHAAVMAGSTRPWRLAAAGISASEAAARVQQRVGGRILAVETVQGRDGVYYRIKVLTRRGEVRVYRVDAATGRVE